MSVLRTFLGRKPCPWALLALFATIALWPIQQAAAQTEKAKNGVVRIVLGGNVMLDGGPGHALSYGEDPFADLAPILTSADIAVCNLECVVAQHGKHVLQRYTFKARPECIPVLKRHFSAVCVANNHSGDYGPEGFLEELDAAGERAPALFRRRPRPQGSPSPADPRAKRPADRLAGLQRFSPRASEAGDGRPGIAWLAAADAIADVKAARSVYHADLVMLMLHWGHEMDPGPGDAQKKLARSLIDAGADAVIGGHPHVRKPSISTRAGRSFTASATSSSTTTLGIPWSGRAGSCD